MNSVVLDASALLAILNQESGAERLTPELLSAAAISTVNLAEVHGKLVGRGLRPDDAWEAALSPSGRSFRLPRTTPGLWAIWSRKPAHLACLWVTGLVWRSGFP